MNRAPKGMAWVSCDRYASATEWRTQHLVRVGGLTTLCGSTASAPDVWERTSTTRRRPKCAKCLAAAK